MRFTKLFRFISTMISTPFIRTAPARSTSRSAWADRSSARATFWWAMATASWSSSLRDAGELAKAAAVKLKEEGQLAGIHAGKGFPAPSWTRSWSRLAWSMSIDLPISAFDRRGTGCAGPLCSLSAIQYSPRSHSPHHLRIRRKHEAVLDLTLAQSRDKLPHIPTSPSLIPQNKELLK